LALIGFCTCLLDHDPMGAVALGGVAGYWLPHPSTEKDKQRFVAQAAVTFVLVATSLWVHFAGMYGADVQAAIYAITALVAAYWLE
jgi:hypothetical protein